MSAIFFGAWSANGYGILRPGLETDLENGILKKLVWIRVEIWRTGRHIPQGQRQQKALFAGPYKYIQYYKSYLYLCFKKKN